MKQIPTKKLLYRALRKDETILTSNLIENHKLKDINLLNEIYSHIMLTYKLRESNSFRTVFSFTEDIVFYTYDFFQNTIKNSSTEKCII